MEERHCPKCAAPIAAEEKFCRNCGFKISQPQEVTKSKKSVPVGALWLVAVLIIAGIIAVGMLTTYVAVSSFDTEKWGTFLTARPEPEPVAPRASVLPAEERLESLPSVAPNNPYVALHKGIVATFRNDTIVFTCAVKNVSGQVITGVGVNLELFDAEKNLIGTNGYWVDRVVQPGEVVEISIDTDNGQSVRMYRLSQIGGAPSSPKVAAAEEQKETDGKIRMTPDEIEKAMGDDPESWVAQQAEKKFIITGPFIKLTPSDDGQIIMAQIGKGSGACYVFVLDPALFDQLEKLKPDAEVCMSGICMTFSSQPQTFVLIDGEFEK